MRRLDWLCAALGLLQLLVMGTKGTGALKRMCYQCHMPYQCSTGFCYGDFCVKSLVGDKYVSKGCENKSLNLYARSVSSEEGTEVGCLESEVFGVPNTVCYCNDVDFCNAAWSISPLGWTGLLGVLVLHMTSFIY